MAQKKTRLQREAKRYLLFFSMEQVSETIFMAETLTTIMESLPPARRPFLELY